MYNFDKVTDRRGTYSLKWELCRENELPMWVADMDLPVSDEITAALSSRAAHGIFGYTIVPDEWYNAYIGHWQSRHGLILKKIGLLYSAGVVPTISCAVRGLTSERSKVAVMPPVYNMFFKTIERYREVCPCDLVYSNGRYSIDFSSLETALSDEKTEMLVLCNPQNPGGIIWSRDELERIGNIAYDNNVTVISDEIHCDLTYPGKEYVPFISVNDKFRENSITCISPTKAFNIAGIQTSAAYAENTAIREKLARTLDEDNLREPNAFAVAATCAAFNDSAVWLDELREHIYRNKEIVKKYLDENLPLLKFYPSDATYLLWIDCAALADKCDNISKRIRSLSGLFMSDGNIYGGNGSTFVRMNIACPKEYLLDGLARLRRAVEQLL